MNTFDKIRNYYGLADEWGRLDSPAGQLEMQEIVHLIESYLPARSKILDLGSGPGRYALAFAELGYFVDLVDLSPRLIEMAKRKFAEKDLLNLVDIFAIGNAIDLSSAVSEKYDAVFCNGPFYHLVDPSDRIMAAREVLRATKPGGLVFIGLIPRFSALAGLIYRATQSSDQVTADNFRGMSDQGVFHNHTAKGFQEGWSPTIGEAKEFWHSLGLRDIEMFSTRSFMYQNEEEVLAIRDRDPALFDEIIRAHRKFAKNESFVEAGGHALLIGHFPG